MHLRWDFPRALRVRYEGLHAHSQPGFSLRHNSTSELSSRSWGSEETCMTAKTSFYSNCTLAASAWKHLAPGFKPFFTVAGRLLSVTKAWLGVVNFSATVPWDGWSVSLTAPMPALSTDGKEGWSSPQMCFLRYSSVEMEEWTRTMREPESGWRKVMSVRKLTASHSWWLPQWKVKFVPFLWIAPISALHLKPGFHCPNEVRIRNVKLCVMKHRWWHFYLLEVCSLSYS